MGYVQRGVLEDGLELVVVLGSDGAGMVQDELFMHPTKPWCGFEIACPMRVAVPEQ